MKFILPPKYKILKKWKYRHETCILARAKKHPLGYQTAIFYFDGTMSNPYLIYEIRP